MEHKLTAADVGGNLFFPSIHFQHALTAAACDRTDRYGDHAWEDISGRLDLPQTDTKFVKKKIPMMNRFLWAKPPN